jgi:hypothetical protein
MYIDIPLLGFKRQILAPFKSLKWVIGFYSFLAIFYGIVGIVGAVIVSLAVFCEATAPELYTYSLYLLIMNWLGIFVIIVYIIKLFFGNTIATMIKEAAREETMEEVESRLFKRAFDECDPSKEGRIKREDLNTVLRAVGVFIPEEEVAQLMETFDSEQSGYITYDVLNTWFRSLSQDADDHNRGGGSRGGRRKGGIDDDDDDDDDDL